MIIEFTKKSNDTYDVLMVSRDGKAYRNPLLLKRADNGIMVYYSKYTALMRYDNGKWLINGYVLTDSAKVLLNCKAWVIKVSGLPYRIVKKSTFYDARKVRWDCMLKNDDSLDEWVVELSYPFNKKGRQFIVSLSSETAIETRVK